jgi:hypothetical protein
LSTITRARTFDELRRIDLDGARALIVSLARNADRPVVRNRGRDHALLTHLDQLGSGAIADPASAAHELDRAILSATTDDAGTATIRAELAALVATMTGTPGTNEREAPWPSHPRPIDRPDRRIPHRRHRDRRPPRQPTPLTFEVLKNIYLNL